MLAEKATQLFLKALEGLQYGQFELVLPNGQVHQFAGDQPGPKGHLKLQDNQVLANMALRGDIAFAEDYQNGKWASDDVAALVECGLRNEACLSRYIFGQRIQQWIARIGYLFTQNSKSGSRKNIHAHYDLGNDFYALWLDPSMTYSSALFKNADDDLVTAQQNKYDRILEKVGDTPQSIIEIGCGWGGFANRGTQVADHQITGITVSPAQHAYATRRLQEKGTQANVRLEDYREVKGQYDALVSIEMFEAVGERYWSTYFKQVKSLLKNKGKAIIQTITIDDAHFARYRRGGDSIRSYIFPGGMLPSPTRFKQEAAKAGLQLVDQYAFGQSYARTLQDWLTRFEAQSSAIQAQGFDEAFIRLWRFYLAACIGSFRAERTDVMQVELQHA